MRLQPNQNILTPEFDLEDPNLATEFNWYKSTGTDENGETTWEMFMEYEQD